MARSSYPQRSAQKNQEKLIKLKETEDKPAKETPHVKRERAGGQVNKKYLYATQETTTRGFKRNEEEQKGSN